MVRKAIGFMEQAVSTRNSVLDTPHSEGRASRSGNSCPRIGQERLEPGLGVRRAGNFAHNELTITLENAFLVDCVRNFCMDDLRAAMTEITNMPCTVRLQHDESIRVSVPEPNGPVQNERPATIPLRSTSPITEATSTTTPSVSIDTRGNNGVSPSSRPTILYHRPKPSSPKLE